MKYYEAIITVKTLLCADDTAAAKRQLTKRANNLIHPYRDLSWVISKSEPAELPTAEGYDDFMDKALKTMEIEATCEALNNEED